MRTAGGAKLALPNPSAASIALSNSLLFAPKTWYASGCRASERVAAGLLRTKTLFIICASVRGTHVPATGDFKPEKADHRRKRWQQEQSGASAGAECEAPHSMCTLPVS